MRNFNTAQPPKSLEKKKLFRVNLVLASKPFIISIMVIAPFFFVFAANYVAALLESTLGLLTGKTDEITYDLENIFRFVNVPMLYIVVAVLTLLFEIVVPYKMRTAHKEMNVGQKGHERFAEIKELRAQYKAVPESGVNFPGKGGIPIAFDREKKQILIDTSPVNNLIIGTTRSGKGECFMLPTIDIYSRAEEKASLIVADPKLELYKFSYQTLKERGYIPVCLNLAEPGKSMRYNPLQLVINAWRKKDYPSGEMLCATFCYSIFNGTDGGSPDNQFWNDTSTNLLSALIIAHVQDCIEKDTKLNHREHDLYLKRREAFDDLTEDYKEAVRNSHIDKSYEEIISERMTPLEPEIEWKTIVRYEKQCTMYSICNTFQSLATQQMGPTKTALDFYFERRPDGDRAKLKYTAANVAGANTKGSIYASMISKLTAFTYESNAKLTAENDIDLLDIGFGDKPYAIFISTPDFDKSNHFIATVFIRQLYFSLAQECTINTVEGKCTREVVFLLDEAGNLPPIESLENIITVCLGRNIRFNLAVQADEQLEKLYGKGVKTIKGNCGNQYFLSSGDGDTAQQFSKDLGTHTITNIHRAGSKLSLNKTFTELYEEQPIMNAQELQHLKEGENVIRRIMTRKDLQGNDIEQAPIFNTGNQRFRYRYQYLTKWFPNLADIDYTKIEWGDTTQVDLSVHCYDINEHFGELIAQHELEKALGEKKKKMEELQGKNS